MPDYKKKKVRRLGYKPPRKVKTKPQKSENIKMEPINKKANSAKEPQVRVVTGKKLIVRERAKKFLAVLLALLVVTTILNFLVPVSIFESLGNAVKTMGAGSYPIELEGSQTLNTVSAKGYFYTLTDSQLKAVSSSGKQIYSVAHGFASPILKTSQTRALIFDQNGNHADIYNLSKKVSEITTEKNILTASICRNGSYAIVTEADNYAAAVSVYNKRDKLLYEWYSSSELINNVVLSPNGKKIAVSTVDSLNGHLQSKLYVLEFDGPDPVFTVDYKENLVYSLENSSLGFMVCAANGVDYISWGKQKRKDYSFDKEVAFFNVTPSGTVVALNLESNRADNTIVLFSSTGKKVCEFDFEGIISDIVLSHGHIYCMSNTTLYKFNKKGELKTTANCNFGGVDIAVISGNEAAVVSNSDITRLKFTSKE